MIRHVESRSREYIDSETGAIRRGRSRGNIKVALVYPNTYPVGMSNLGFQTVYRLFNDMEQVVCERAFIPEKGPLPADIRTLETRRRLTEFHIVAFSISFENDYPHVLTVLEASGLPVRSADRTDSMPLVVAGGVACFLNPEPLAAFIDCFFIGEAESLLPGFFQVYDPKIRRRDVLRDLADQLPGMYVPSLYRTEYHGDGTIKSVLPISRGPEKILRSYARDLSEISTTSVIVSPHTSFGRMFLIETSRGCPHGCRFCTTGYMYSPFRFRHGDQLLSSLKKGMAMTNRIGLVGAAIADLPDLPQVCEAAKAAKALVSFSSFRADRLTPHLISLIRESRSKTATLAPDAGSQRMRDVIRKRITEENVLNAVDRLVSADIPHIRLYFMIGLPTETLDDVMEIVNLCRRVKQIFLDSSRKKGKMGAITVSVNPFVPKPFTPFQWAAMEDISVLQKKIKLIESGLKKMPNIRLIVETPREAMVQALLSRGDQRVADVLLRLSARRQNWTRILKDPDCKADFHATRERSLNEIFPWSHIDHGFETAQLESEYGKALKAQP
jgi:radical SAM superfamily enzyme YgiQ (UPF0313 family)